MNNTIQTIALIVIIGFLLGCFEGIKYPVNLALVSIGVLLAAPLISKKEGSGAEREQQEQEEENDIEVGNLKGRKQNKGLLGSIINKENLKVFTQAFTLTFLAEWGDRSQIATIALAASKNVMGVIVGGLLGHAFCTGLAVIGGRMLAARISEKTVAIVGGVLFLAFAIHSFAVGPDVN